MLAQVCAVAARSILGNVRHRPLAFEIGIERGKAGPGRSRKTDSNSTRLGRGSDYELASLDRERPDLAERARRPVTRTGRCR